MSNDVLKGQKPTGLAHRDRLDSMSAGKKNRAGSPRRKRQSRAREGENLKVPGRGGGAIPPPGPAIGLTN
jgi:hypothetical protein